MASRWLALLTSRSVLLAGGLLAFAIGLMLSYIVVISGDAAATKQAAGKPEPNASAVAALGRIEPSSEIFNLGAGFSPDRLETLLVARGDLVKKGQVLGRLGGYAEQIAQRDVLGAQLDEARVRLKTEIELNQTRVATAEIRRRQVHEVSPLKIAVQEATVRNLEAKLTNDRDILESQAQLFERGVSSRRLNTDQKANVSQGEASLAGARALLLQLKQQFEVDIIDADVQIELARAQLERAKVEFPLASLKAQIAQANARADRMTLYAPIDGRILNIKVKI